MKCKCNHSDLLLCHECEESTGVCYCKCHEDFKRPKAQRTNCREAARSQATSGSSRDFKEKGNRKWLTRLSSEARAAFVTMVKDENFYSEVCKQSLRQHWNGPASGFHEYRVQLRWKDFLAGWKAKESSK